LLLVGNTIDIISGVLVQFDDEILSSYGSCMKNIEESALSWAYDLTIPFPKNEVTEASPPRRTEDFAIVPSFFWYTSKSRFHL
jgi:hypothetical protein